MRSAHRRARRLDGRRLHFERCHQLHQLVNLVGRIAGAGLAGVAQLAVLVDAEQQRAEAALLVRRRPADDDELLALDALGLDPAARPRADIFGIGALGDDAFEPRLAKGAEQLLAAPDDVIGVADLGRAGADQRGELLLALRQRSVGEVLAVKREQIEGVIEDERRIFLQRILERLETGRPSASSTTASPSSSADEASRAARRRRRARICRSSRARSGCRRGRRRRRPRSACGSRRTSSRAAIRCRRVRGRQASPAGRGGRAGRILPRWLLLLTCGGREPVPPADLRLRGARPAASTASCRPRSRPWSDPLSTPVRWVVTRSSEPPACSSATLRSSQFSPFSRPRGFSRIMIHSPFIRWPWRMKWRWPSGIVLRGSLPAIDSQVPLSHSITVPPPYWPLGSCPRRSHSRAGGPRS